jgi:hypothetical protein
VLASHQRVVVETRIGGRLRTAVDAKQGLKNAAENAYYNEKHNSDEGSVHAYAPLEKPQASCFAPDPQPARV